jgi:solute:Na+ symporter, SSS family
MKYRWPDLIIIAVYLLAVAWIGWRCSRRQTSTETYFLAKRSIPHWAMAFSMFATLISSITFIGYPGSGYASNWNELVQGFMVIGALLLVGLVVIPFYRHVVGVSAYEYFGKRFGYGARAYSALAFSLGHFSKMGFVFFLLALTIHSMTGWNVITIILVTGVVTILYTMIGGLEAVIWTDFMQGIIMWIGVVAVLIVLFTIMPGGIGEAFSLAREHDKFSLGSFDFDLKQKGFWAMSLYGFFWFFQKYTGDQTIVQRYLVAKSDREALKGVAAGALMCVPIWTLFILVGTLLWAYYQLSGELLPAHVDKADKVFPYFLSTKMPVGLAGLFMAALFAAGMSTLSSDLNCLSAVAVEDYYRKLFPNATDARRLLVGKVVVAVCGVAALAIAIVIALAGERVFALYLTVSSILTGGIAGIFILAFLSRRSNKGGIWVGIIACLVFTTWATLTSGKSPVLDLGRYGFPYPGIMIGVIGHLVVVVFGYAASFLFHPPSRESQELTLWGWLARRKATPPDFDSCNAASPSNKTTSSRQ